MTYESRSGQDGSRLAEPIPELIPQHSEHTMLRSLPPSVNTARRFVRQVVTGFGLTELVSDAELITSELVTNSINATGDGVSWVIVSVHMHQDPSYLVLEISDSSPDRPVFRDPGLEDTSGRGLWIVEALSSRWGCRWPTAGGKTVWAQIGLADAAQEVGSLPTAEISSTARSCPGPARA